VAVILGVDIFENAGVRFCGIVNAFRVKAFHLCVQLESLRDKALTAFGNSRIASRVPVESFV
jgi:hypothetical protein